MCVCVCVEEGEYIAECRSMPKLAQNKNNLV